MCSFVHLQRYDPPSGFFCLRLLLAALLSVCYYSFELLFSSDGIVPYTALVILLHQWCIPTLWSLPNLNLASILLTPILHQKSLDNAKMNTYLSRGSTMMFPAIPVTLMVMSEFLYSMCWPKIL